MNVTTITMTATTLVIGRSRGRNSSLKNQIGSVRSCPAVNSVTMISSNDSANASMPPASSAVAHLRQHDVPEGLPAVGAEVHRRLDPALRHAPQARDDVVVDDDDAERRVARDDRPEAGIDARALDRGEQRDAGDDAGQRDRQHEQHRDAFLAAETCCAPCRAPSASRARSRATWRRRRPTTTAASQPRCRCARTRPRTSAASGPAAEIRTCDPRS